VPQGLEAQVRQRRAGEAAVESFALADVLLTLRLGLGYLESFARISGKRHGGSFHCSRAQVGARCVPHCARQKR
jgi:hypothetical protein